MSLVSESGVLDGCMIADHLPVFIVKKKPRNDKKFTYTYGRSYKNYNKDIFQDLIMTNMRWRSFWNKTNDPDMLWDIMFSIVVEAADHLCPLIRMKIRSNVPGWITKEIIDVIARKRELLKIATKNELKVDWDAYKESRNQVRKMLVKARQAVIVSSLNENRNDPRRFWKILNVDLGLSEKRSKNNQSFCRIKNEEGKILDGEQACIFMSEYYASNGVKLASKFTNCWDEKCSKIIKPNEAFIFKFIPMTVVEKHIKNIEVCKSSGLPDISSQLLKDAFLVLVPELTHLFNESLSTGVFPQSWCTGRITPIPKDGDLLSAGNWRPISLLPLPSKLLEKIVHYQISVFLEENRVLDPRQHGFRSSFSTSTAIFALTKYLFQNYNEGNSTSCVLVDYSKAFETLDHDILCTKLGKYNFSNIAVSWFKSYLMNRQHIVQTNTIQSLPCSVPCGVPQGSTLGPLLFILYVNDLLSSLKTSENGNVLMYADDTVLYSANIDPTECMKNTQMLVDKLAVWCSFNRLTINIGKTKHMFVPRTNDIATQTSSSCITIDQQRLHNVKAYKYLGVDMDCSLTFSSLVDNIYTKANRKLYMLKYIRPYVTNSIANLIYKTCIRPIMEYADFLIDSCNKAKIEKLENIQKRAIKIIDWSKHKGIKYKDMCFLYGLDDLKVRRKKHHLAVMFRHSHDPTNLVIARPDVVLRSNNKVKFRRKTTQLTKVLNGPYYRGVTLWDMLPVSVQRATTKVKFKKELNIHLG